MTSPKPIAIGAKAPMLGSITVDPMMKTRKKVQMNSTMYFFILVGLSLVCLDKSKLCFFGVVSFLA
mgnify:CR=1 FL=1